MKRLQIKVISFELLGPGLWPAQSFQREAI